MKFNLPFGIEVDFDTATITSPLKQGCPYCNQVECYFDCDQSQYDDDLETEDETNNRRVWNAAIDGVESLILALVLAGVPVDDKFREGVEVALEAIGNNLGD